MKLKDIMEEMGARGMGEIQKTLMTAQKIAKVKGRYSIVQREGGSSYVLKKGGKDIATIPAMKANDKNYIISILTRYEK